MKTVFTSYLRLPPPATIYPLHTHSHKQKQKRMAEPKRSVQTGFRFDEQGKKRRVKIIARKELGEEPSADGTFRDSAPKDLKRTPTRAQMKRKRVPHMRAAPIPGRKHDESDGDKKESMPE